MHLEFRAPDRTLTDEEVASARASIAKQLETTFGATLRA
jgi:phenylalanyl-tRNA synthetase beta subunit